MFRSVFPFFFLVPELPPEATEMLLALPHCIRSLPDMLVVAQAFCSDRRHSSFATLSAALL
jgi:hypothetical protein